MILGRLLKVVGRGAVKEIPLGGLIVDVIEIATKKKIDRETVTGEELEKLLTVLPLGERNDILSRKFDNELVDVLSLKQAVKQIPNETTMDKARYQLALITTIIINLMALMFLGILMFEYVTKGVVPDLESVLLTLGIPAVVLFTMFGLDTRAMMSLLLSAQQKKYNKK